MFQDYSNEFLTRYAIEFSVAIEFLLVFIYPNMAYDRNTLMKDDPARTV